MSLDRRLFFSGLACFGLLISAASPPPSDSSVEDIKRRQEQLEKQKQATRAKIGETDEQIREKIKLQNAKERELEQRRKHLRQLEQKLAAYEIQKNYIGSLIPETAENLGNLRELARRRIRELYKEGTKPFIAYMMEAHNDVDFVDRVFYARLLIAHDYETFSRLKGTYGRLQALSRKYEDLSRETISLKKQVEHEASLLRAEIKRFSAEKQKLLADLRALEQAYEDLEEESITLANELRRRAGEGLLLAPFDGAFKWPVRGRLTSGFGMRRHPILRKRKFHTGIDIALPRGSVVSAAASGTVLIADYKGGYGLAVLILHGDYQGKSYSTLYGHLDEILVEEGALVEAGDPIGKIGCTGLCTGPHLHFEIRADGDPVDPLTHLK
ncbi:MAG: murein hydrolase activator EnvC family protein [bacterium JZ-2024 1]